MAWKSKIKRKKQETLVIIENMKGMRFDAKGNTIVTFHDGSIMKFNKHCTILSRITDGQH